MTGVWLASLSNLAIAMIMLTGILPTQAEVQDMAGSQCDTTQHGQHAFTQFAQ